MNKLAIIAIAALVIASAVVVVAQQAALASDRDRDSGDRTNQEGKCRNCQQQQAVNNEDSLNTESGDVDVDGNNVDATSGDANGGQFQNREGGG
jgi:hypothetical protein